MPEASTPASRCTPPSTQSAPKTARRRWILNRSTPARRPDVKRRLLLVVAAASIALPLAGCLYETTSARRAARKFPPPGRLIDVGGRRLHLLCIGSGRPIVLFEASGFSNSASSAAARTGLARRTTVCSYDRAGVGWSDPGPDVMSVGQLADDLRQLQDRALDSRIVIVTSSIGGLVSELFA